MYLRVGSGGTCSEGGSSRYHGSFMVGTSLPSSPHIELKVDGTANFVGDDVRIGITGTGGNERATLNLISPDTISSSLNVFYVTRAGTSTCTISSGGDATFAGTINGTTVGTSDQRFKENISPAGSQLEDVVALGGILKNFDWNEDAPVSDEIRATRQLGLIAQEAEVICPSLVKTIVHTKNGEELTPEVIVPASTEIDADGEEVVIPEKVIRATYEQVEDNYKGISHDALIMKLLGAVAELSNRTQNSSNALTTQVSDTYTQTVINRGA